MSYATKSEERIRLEEAARAAEELHVRQLRRTCSTSLLKFIKEFWRVVEPDRDFVQGWALEAICEHLEAVTYGQTNRLLMNVPYGFMKSLSTDVFWPAWEWGPLDLPSMRYVAFSYSSDLTERDNLRFSDVVRSSLYQKAWGKHVSLPPVPGARKVRNLQTGWKIASSVGGVGTGERGDRVICFPYDELVATEQGPRKIGDLVENKEKLRAWSYNSDTGNIELRQVLGWNTNPGCDILRVTLSDGSSVRCTGDHRLLGVRGYVEASRLAVGDRLLAASSGMFVTASAVAHPRKVEVLPDRAAADSGDCGWAYTKFSSKNLGGIAVALRDLAHKIFGQVRHPIAKGSVPFAVRYVLGARSILEIFEGWARSVAVLVPHFLPRRAGTNKRRHDQLVAETELGDGAVAQGNPWVSMRQGLLENPPGNPGYVGRFDVADAVGVFTESSAAGGRSGDAVDAPKAGNEVAPLVTSDRKPFFVRVVSVERCGHAEKTYCLTVSRNHNMLCGDHANIVAANCDDPHNVKMAESETVRKETVRWFRESITSRMNDPMKSAIVVIMQRVHEDDVAGAILENELGYTHLCIPMEMDWVRGPTLGVGWSDPRQDEDGDPIEGALAFPERFPQEAVDRDKVALGPVAAAAQLQQSPAPRGGNIIERDWWQPWPPDANSKDYQGANFDPTQYPPMSLVVGSVDTSYGEKDENAYNAMTIWGLWSDCRDRPNAMLMHAWRKRLPLRGFIPEGFKTDDELRPHWGLVEHVANSVRHFGIDVLLIEDKTRGHDLRAELVRLLRTDECQIVMIQPKADKVARLHSVQPMFASGMIWAPFNPETGQPKVWAGMVIDETCSFPKSRYADLVDTTSQALSYLRRQDLLLLAHEADEDNLRRNTFVSQKVSPYDV